MRFLHCSSLPFVGELLGVQLVARVVCVYMVGVGCM